MSEVILFGEGLELRLPEGSGEIIDLQTEAFLAGTNGSYGETFAGTKEAFEREGDKRDGSAYFVPSVRFLIKTALNLLAQEGADKQIPNEVEDRQRVAGFVVSYLAEAAGESGVFSDAYRAVGLPLYARDYFEASDTDSISSLAQAAFSDARILAGGALKILGDEAPDIKRPAEVIQGSYGLLKMSVASETASETIREEMGEPYAHARNLVITRGDNDERVRLSPGAWDMIERNIKRSEGEDRGCPAGKIQAVSMRGTIILEDWRDLVAYLVPAGATVENYDEGKLAGIPV